MFRALLRKLFGFVGPRKASKQPYRRSSIRLDVETLETRELMAASLDVGLNANLLPVSGNQTSPATLISVVSDNFDSYAAGSLLAGQGGWQGDSAGGEANAFVSKRVALPLRRRVVACSFAAAGATALA